MANNMTMDGHRAVPHDFKRVYSQTCENFAHKLETQVFAVLETKPNTDSKPVEDRIAELGDKALEIGFLANAGEMSIRDHPKVKLKWGNLSVQEICRKIKDELHDIREQFHHTDRKASAERLAALAMVLPF
ncbi:hypothetical protein N7541_008111 [Penicillium brevicompactum]|uniref:Uncharacterized protein n=1 Tax=Penicillium brevicompactum TaxID=5074 RepID=A0A9W9R0Q2_PENBR|nr:hypothetical protein N7541_008111 [Penicillium brevicompactum]